MSDFHSEELKKLSDKKYLIKDNFLGEGAFAKVYECKNKKQSLVVKIYSKDDKKYAVHELNLFNKLKKHKKEFTKDYFNKSNIIDLLDYYVSNDYIYAIFERATMSLEDFIISFNKQFNSRPPIFLIVKIIKEILIGLIELNRCNIIHSDLKLDNVFLNFKTNENEFFNLFKQKKMDHGKILESFSIKLIDLNKSTFINQIIKPLSIQTIEYQAPEIVFGNNNYNESLDIWSIGIILWNLITGFELIDINNTRVEYYPFYKNYEKNDDDDSSMEDEESVSESTSEYFDSNDPSTIYQNTIYLNKLHSIIGECDKSLIVGGDIDKYYKSNKLIGHSFISYSPCIHNIILNEKDNFKFTETDIEIKLKYLSDLLEKNILIYDFKKRLTPFDLYEILDV